jgi:hypothetical protein
MALGVVLLMTVKPGWSGVLIVLVLSVLLGMLSVLLAAYMHGSAAVAEAPVLGTR